MSQNSIMCHRMSQNYAPRMSQNSIMRHRMSHNYAPQMSQKSIMRHWMSQNYHWEMSRKSEIQGVWFTHAREYEYSFLPAVKKRKSTVLLRFLLGSRLLAFTLAAFQKLLRQYSALWVMTSKRKMIDCKLTNVLDSRTNRDIPQSQFVKSRIFEFWRCFVASNYPSHTWQIKLIVSAKWYRRYNSKWSADTRYNYHHCLKGDCLPPWRRLPPGVFMVL